MEENVHDIKVGDKVRINHPAKVKWHGREGVVTAIALNGAILRFPNGRGTAVKFSHLSKI